MVKFVRIAVHIGGVRSDQVEEYDLAFVVVGEDPTDFLKHVTIETRLFKAFHAAEVEAFGDGGVRGHCGQRGVVQRVLVGEPVGPESGVVEPVDD